MKNNLFIIFIIFFFAKNSYAENLDIEAGKIYMDKNDQISIFENKVVIKDESKNLIKSNYAKLDKKSNFLILKDNVVIVDEEGNEFHTEHATYDRNEEIIKSFGKSKIISAQGYVANTEDLIIDKKINSVFSQNTTIISDLDGNLINLENFEYYSKKNIFKSIGKINLKDKLGNSYNFSQIYIDEREKEIIGTDAKSYLNQDSFKYDERNKPRVFSNVVNIKENETKFFKSNFTLCNYRDQDKCPPWQILSTKMQHDKKKKTIYYDNAVVKLYDVPIFYSPKLAHPDHTVQRRSGFLIPSYSDTKNLGSALHLPYFWAIGEDKDLTINNRLFVSEHPLFLGDYRQAFKDANLNVNFGYTEGYKKVSSKKQAGDKSHFFSKFSKDFNNDEIENNLEINLQHVSHKKYLKLYKIDSDLVNDDTNILENSLNLSSHNNDSDLFVDLKASSFTSLADNYNDKYEYFLPDISLTKNLVSKNFGYGDINTNMKIHNFDTNKTKKILTNNFNWNLEQPFAEKKYNATLLSSIKNFNYETKNIKNFKEDTTSELFGAIGYLASLDLYKSKNKEIDQFLTPKILLRTSPNKMKKENSEIYLYNKDIFTLDRLGVDGNMESGTNLTVGFDYERLDQEKEFNFSIGQIISEKKSNKDMPSSSSLDKRFSDIIGNLNYTNNKNFTFNYDYSLDQNYKETNLNKIDAVFDNDFIGFNLNYLEEEKINEEKEYVKSTFNIKKGDNGKFSLSSKRNLITSSTEFYNLSYEYINDCLRAGLVYRREFYDDSELEPENTLMFKVTLTPFGQLSSPGFSQ